MIKHCVFLNFKSETSESEQFDIFEGLSNLKNQVEGLNDFEYGNNLDFEQKSADFNSGFIASFENHQALLQYNEHPEHVLLGSKLVSMCKGGHQGIIVFDIET
ncbi:Dabb family protein [Candidatus Thioglobus sp.]|nr:Dabb family protein [Candidatus Thioglobus sp.]